MNITPLPDFFSTYTTPLTLEQDLVVWDYLNQYLAQMITYHWKKEFEAQTANNTVVQEPTLGSQVRLLYDAYNLSFDSTSARRIGRFSKLVELLLRYAVDTLNVRINQEEGESFTTLTEFLDYGNFKISKMFLGLSDLLDDITDTYVYPEGFWFYESEMQDEAGTPVLYFFELDVATDPNFSTILFSMDSLTDQTGWYYESSDNDFVAVPAIGVSSIFAGKRIKYESQVAQYLTRGNIYYFRVKQKTITTDYNYTRTSGIIFT